MRGLCTCQRSCELTHQLQLMDEPYTQIFLLLQQVNDRSLVPFLKILTLRVQLLLFLDQMSGQHLSSHQLLPLFINKHDNHRERKQEAHHCPVSLLDFFT